MARIDRQKRALGGAIKRKAPSKAATYLHESGELKGSVLDYGCGYGICASFYGWSYYDPYYHPDMPEGEFETIVCISVLNALSRNNRKKVLEKIDAALSSQGKAFLVVPRDIPQSGKLSIGHRIQNYVVLKLPLLFEDENFAIYIMQKGAVIVDKTKDYVSRRDQAKKT